MRSFFVVMAFAFAIVRADRAHAVQNLGSSVIVADPWSFKAFNEEMTARFQADPVDEPTVRRNDGLLTPLYFPPLNILSWIYFRVIGRDSVGVASEISKRCSSVADLGGRILCLSNGVASYVETMPRFANGVTFDARTFCAVAANLFVKVFNALEIPRARADYLDGSLHFPKSLHVVNVIYLTDPRGRVFTYVIDNGNLPGVLFPLSEAAIRYHTGERGGSKTKRSTFPAIDFQRAGAFQFSPSTK